MEVSAQDWAVLTADTIIANVAALALVMFHPEREALLEGMSALVQGGAEMLLGRPVPDEQIDALTKAMERFAKAARLATSSPGTRG